jgi:hyperosmotically inducible protein
MDSAVALAAQYDRSNPMNNSYRQHTAIAAAVLLALGVIACTETETTSGGTVTVVKPAEQTASGPVTTPTEPSASTTTPAEQLASATSADPARDEAITASVKAEIAKEPDMSSQNIQVTTRGSVVTLTGQVDDEAKIDRAKFLAQSVEGIADVNNELVVTGTG